MIKSLNDIRKVFILGDLHIGIRNASAEWAKIQLEYIDYFLNAVDEHGFDPERDILIQLGDWHHVRESINIRISEVSMEIADKLCTKFKRGVLTILGNHDVYYKDRTDVNSLKWMAKLWPNFYLYETPQAIQVNNYKFFMLPWVESTSDIKDHISMNQDCDYIFCHTDIKGFSLNRRVKLEHGLDASDLLSFKRIYSGHIHIRQTRGNVVYVGTPYELDRGDRGNSKGFYVLDMYKPIPVEDFVLNDISPKHLKYFARDVLNMSLEKCLEAFSNNFVDISIDPELASKFKYAEFAELFANSTHHRLDFIPYTAVLDDISAEINMNDSYEYNIFTILDEQIQDLPFTAQYATTVKDKFTEIYNSINADAVD